MTPSIENKCAKAAKQQATCVKGEECYDALVSEEYYSNREIKNQNHLQKFNFGHGLPTLLGSNL